MSLSGKWVLLVRKSVYGQLARFPAADRTRIGLVINSLPQNPFAGDVEKIDGDENLWRRRVGKYRIFFELIKKDVVVYVTEVKRRTSSTY